MSGTEGIPAVHGREDVKTAPAEVGVVGLGNMGLPMAGHLLAAGFGVRGYDVRPEAVGALARAGGTPTASPAEAVAGAPVAVTSLPSVAALQEVVGGEHGPARRWTA